MQQVTSFQIETLTFPPKINALKIKIIDYATNWIQAFVLKHTSNDTWHAGPLL
jgi:hypothetical protein